MRKSIVGSVFVAGLCTLSIVIGCGDTDVPAADNAAGAAGQTAVAGAGGRAGASGKAGSSAAAGSGGRWGAAGSSGGEHSGGGGGFAAGGHAGVGGSTAGGHAGVGGTAGSGGSAGNPQNVTSLCLPSAPWPKGDPDKLLIDDFEDLDENIPHAFKATPARKGVWTLSADMSKGANTFAGTTRIAINSILKPVDGKLSVKGGDYGAFIRKNDGKNYWGWGAALVASLNKTNLNCPLDASTYGGIKFKIKGTSEQPASIQIGVPEVIPLGGGGTCMTPGDADCYNKHKYPLSLNGAEQTYVIAWRDFKQDPEWGLQVKFSPAQISSIEIAFPQQAKQATEETAGNPVRFDVEVDDLQFVPIGTETATM